MRLLRRMDRDLLAVAGIALALVLFLSLNLLATTTLGRVRLDLTENARYTLSQGTRRTLAAIDEPVTLRLYLSDGLRAADPALADHAARVRDLLQRYVRLADGGIELEILRPEPFSPAEDRAVAAGLRALPTPGRGGGSIYFGLAGTNSTDDTQTIPFFAPDRAAFLEYDLTRLVHALAHPRKPVVGVLGALPVAGDMAAGEAPWRVAELMRQGYRVRTLDAGTARIDPAVDILLLAQPTGLEAAARYAVDQFLMGGGKVLAFVDPFAEALAYRGGAQRPDVDAGRLDDGARRLLAGWGVSIDPARIVADRRHARQVRARVGGRETVVDYVGWLALPAAAMAGDDAVTANLSELTLKSAGAIEDAGDGAPRVRPLLRSSAQSMPLAVERIADFPNPAKLLAAFEASQRRYTLAARIDGPFATAFPDGPPGAGGAGPHRKTSAAGAHVVLVADSDMLADGSWTRPQERGGEQVRVPSADNGDFVLNALDNLAGGENLIGLRGRGVRERPFTLIERMRRAAESVYRSREQRLIERIDDAKARIRELRRREERTGVLMTAEQQREVEELRADMLAARGELREVQHKLREDVERVKTIVRAANIWGVPSLVALAALLLGAARRRRRARGRTPARRSRS